MKILIIDDSNTARYVLVKLLRDLAYKDVCAVESAEEGLIRLKADRYDLILLDWNLDGMSGMDFLKIVRADANFKNVAIIMVTTVNERNSVIQALKVGVQGYFFKPVTKETLEAKLKEIAAKIEADVSPPAAA